MRALVVADDLGYCPERNRAIFELLENRQISNASRLGRQNRIFFLIDPKDLFADLKYSYS